MQGLHGRLHGRQGHDHEGGLSRGITGSLTDWGKGIIILLMFLGRVGPVMMGMAFFRTPAAPDKELPEEDVAI